MFKPCPFCGNEDISVTSDYAKKLGGSTVSIQCYCYMCSAKGPVVTLVEEGTLDVKLETVNKATTKAKGKWNERINDE